MLIHVTATIKSTRFSVIILSSKKIGSYQVGVFLGICEEPI